MTRPTSDKPIRVVVAPHHSEIGGSQINALELAGAIARRPEYQVILFMPDGQLLGRATALGLELHITALGESAPNARRILQLLLLIHRRKPDLIHLYEWAPSIDGYLASSWSGRIPLLSTILSMDYPSFLPRSLPMVLGTRALQQQASQERRTAVLIEPPVDTEVFAPGALSNERIEQARRECGATPDDALVVVVGRIAALLKLDGLIALVRAIPRVAAEHPVRLAIVGDGPESERVAALVADVNRSLGEARIRMLGERADPLAYYLAADIVVGMGSSALRAMAAGKPVLVQGERAYWEIVAPESIPAFLRHGWYGVGDGVDSETRCAEALLRLLASSSAERKAMGLANRALVIEHCSLDVAAEKLDAAYRHCLDRPRPGRSAALRQSINVVRELTKYHVSVRWPIVRRVWRRLRRRGLADVG